MIPSPRVLACLSLALPLLATATGAEPYQGLSPAEELKSFRLPPGFLIELAACEPEIADPVSVAWDEKGRLWITEMADYPLGPPAGRVRCLEDRDGDGRYETGRVFAEGLPFPTSALPFRAGLLVSAAPDILYLEDGDGDGRADARRAVLTGFAQGNTQLRVNCLIRGPDNRIYCANGRSDGKPRRPADPPGRAVDIGQRDCRFDPDTFEPEAISGRSQFGHAFDAWGRRFLSWNTIHVRQDVLSPRDLERHPRLLRTATVAQISDHGDSARIYPLVPPPRTFNNEPTDHFNASCGLAIEKGGLFPTAYAGNAYVCEPLTGIVHRDVLEPGPGPALRARRGEGESDSEFLASIDPWFHPVFLRSGPDGALYVVDFYREMVEHPDYVPRELRQGVDFTRGKGHGRIWRVRPADRRTIPVEDLGALGAAALVERLGSPNGQVRETAQRLLIEKRDPEALGPLSSLARGGAPLERAWALWTLRALGRLERELLEKALRSREPRLQEAALRIAREGPHLAALAPQIIPLGADPDPGVRLQAALALGDLREERREGEVVVALAKLAAGDPLDPWIQTAVASSLRARERPFLEALFREGASAGAEAVPAEFVGEIAELAGAGGDEGSESALLELALAQGPTARGFALGGGLARGLRRAGRSGTILAAEGKPLAPRWRSFFDRGRAAALDPDYETALRAAALSTLAHAPWDLAASVLERSLGPRSERGLQLAAARAVRDQESEGATSLILSAWPSATPAAVRPLLFDALLSRPARLRALVEAIETGSIDPGGLDPGRRQALLRALEGKERDRLQKHFLPEGSRAAVLDRYRSTGSEGGDAGRGCEVFQKNCASCHRFAGRGRAVGPDLSGIGKKSREELLVALLDPSRAVVEGYEAYSVFLETGELLTGVLASETATALTLRRADGIEDSIPRSAIRSLSATGLSLMPEGIEEVIPPSEMIHLLEFLRVGERADR
jgi:putative membrane-bound dehydrogenase-like protein